MMTARLTGETAKPDSPDQRLWRAVVYNAMCDSLGVCTGAIPDKSERDAYRRRCVTNAIGWFKRNRADFALVCQLADIDQAMTREVALQSILFRWGALPYQAVRDSPKAEMSRRHLRSLAAGGCNVLIKTIIDDGRYDD